VFKKKLLLILVLIVLVNVIFVFGATVDDYKPGWLKDYSANQSGILHNFWHSLNPFIPDKNQVDPYSNADVYGWYNNTFFGLANWEREVCLLDLSTDVRQIRNVVEDTTLGETTIYTTTLTVSATRERGFNNTWLYEVSWYIMPYIDDALYRVYLKKGIEKEYFEGKKGDDDDDFSEAYMQVGDSGYEARYMDIKYEQVILEYKNYGSDNIQEMVVSVVDKKTP